LKFLHSQPGELAQFISGRALLMFSCDANGSGSKPMGLDRLDAYFAESNVLWGTAPKTFVYVGVRPPAGLTLPEAIRRAESERTGADFVPVGYQDGGVISVTKEKQEFQASAQPADWWKA
jgi:hypothetical protein